ncbi:MAG TPA: aldose epimerase family protein [Pyrinomonadaceae bacterium]
MRMTKSHFGTTVGREVDLYSLSTEGIEVSITNYGGAITSIRVPDRKGDLGDVVLGYETLQEYVRNPRFFGALIGRSANRIARGRFTLDGVEYQLAQNNGENHLHGGTQGFDKVVWEASDELDDDRAVLRLRYLSKDGEENYPGNLTANVSYVLTRERELRIEYHAVTDKRTIVNLTNHSYFNLAGTWTIRDHELTLNADAFTPVSSELIPTGEIRKVDGTPMDFREPTPIGRRINEPYDQLGFTGGYDHNFVLNDSSGALRLAARAYDPSSGRVLEAHTTQPGIQFYSGNFLDGSLTGKGGVVYQKHAGFCLEPQHFPDSPNHPNFPSTVLLPGDEYQQTTVFRFGVV